MDTYIVFWLAATVVFVLVELMTVGLTSICLAAMSWFRELYLYSFQSCF